VLLDTLTLHTLGIFALQNLLITLLGAGAVFLAFFSLGHCCPDGAGSPPGSPCSI